MYLNEATLLNNLKIRYEKDLIYVSDFINIYPKYSLAPLINFVFFQPPCVNLSAIQA